MDIGADSLDWHIALDSYRYPVDLGQFPGRSRFPGWFDLDLEKADLEQTTQFETRFRECAGSGLEPWYEVVFWKMFSQGRVRANLQTERAIERIQSHKTLANTLWEHCDEYIRSETKASFTQFQDLLIKWDSIAIAFTFPAFSCPTRFPMVDKRIARYVAFEASRLDFPTAPEIDETLKRYGDADGGVLTLRDWPFIKAWVNWCRTMADRLSAHKKRVWRARDVEMAVFRAWGEGKERKSCFKRMPRYKLIDTLAHG